MLTSTFATLQDNSAHGDDSLLIRDLGNNRFLDVVMDGVTGHGGDEASRSLKEALEEATIGSIDDVEEVLRSVNEEFFQVGGGHFLLTTVSAALYLGEKLQVLGAGDSPVFLVGPDSFQQVAGRVGGFLHVGVARAIGASPDLPNLSRTEADLSPGTRLILATDGLTDNVLTEDLLRMIRQAATPEEAAKEIDGVIETYLREGRMPEQLGRRFRHDDRSGIFRFFDG